MMKTKKLLTATMLTGMTLAVAASAVAPFNAKARAAVSAIGVDIVSERIGGAFDSLLETNIDPAIAAAATRAAKGDLSRTAACVGATWPNIDPSCLSKADGSPVPRVRAITIGYQAGANTTVLVRVPAGEVALQ